MGAVKANNNKDTYKATAVAFIVIGTLFLINKLLPFASIGLPWVMNKDNLLLYASISFLIFKRDKSVGFVLLGLWLEYRSGNVIARFLVRLSVAIGTVDHRNYFILGFKTLKKQ
mgnify:CR=1 FL=1